MRYLKAILLAGVFCLGWFCAQAADYAAVKAAAEKLCAEGSYSLAHDKYSQLDLSGLSGQDKRWVEFRLADTLWRSEAASPDDDDSKAQEAFQSLQELIKDITRKEQKDLVWAETNESIADFYWTRENRGNWWPAQNFYKAAFEYWAGSKDIKAARPRYLGLIWKCVEPGWMSRRGEWDYGNYGNWLDIETIDNGLKIAQDPKDISRLRYLAARTLSRSFDEKSFKRIEKEYTGIIDAGINNPYYDDALFHYGQWLLQYSDYVGRAYQGESQQALISQQKDSQRVSPVDRPKPDYAKALKLFQRLVTEFKKGETKYFDQAQELIKEITESKLEFRAAEVFLPDSLARVYLNWRNISRVDFELYRVELTRDADLTALTSGADEALRQAKVSAGQKVKSFKKDLPDKGDYVPGSQELVLEDKLPAGAYILEGKAKDKIFRELVLVSDKALVVKTCGQDALVYFSNVFDGAPVPGADIALWERVYENNRYVWKKQTAKTDSDGLCRLSLIRDNNSGELLALASSGENQAFSLGHSYYRHRDQSRWKIYAYCDRPAYRPKETVQFKFICRVYDGNVYATPAAQEITYVISDPRGAKLKEGKTTLNSFGSGFDRVELGETLPLGAYTIAFSQNGNHIGSAVLFRLEEYKLPEFKVSVKTPEVEGKKKTFTLGDKIELDITAEYYFGGPVADADCEVVVYQSAYYSYWRPLREYGWFYADLDRDYQHRHWGRGQVVKQEKIKTDAQGRAKFSFDTPASVDQDFEYRVEARVTDASRRQITASDKVRVTRQGYYAHLVPQRYISRPKEKISVDIKTLDANDQPVSVSGTVKVLRRHWQEVWLDEFGKEVLGETLKRRRAENKVFPPISADGKALWSCKYRGYEETEVSSQSVTTSVQGEAEFSFTCDKEGYYCISWLGKDKNSGYVKSETCVWVADKATNELGYQAGGLEILADKDTFRAGEIGAVMLVAPVSGRWVLFTSETDKLDSFRLVKMSGTVKLVELPIEEKHVPNFFLGALMFNERQLYQATKQIVVPPVKNFLDVKVKTDRPQYQPQEEAVVDIEAKDYQGKPVQAELSLAAADEAVYYIQQDLAGDIRQFFYGDKRQSHSQIQSTLNRLQYRRWELDQDEKLIDRLNRDAGDYSGRQDEQVGEKLNYADATGFAVVMGEDKAKEASQPSSLEAPRNELRKMISKGGGEMSAEPEAEPAVRVRTDFRSTLFWQPDIVTATDGKAQVKVKFADSLTAWKLTARACGSGNTFGNSETTCQTQMPLIARLQAPRFFTVGDQVVISGNINNNTDEALTVKPQLKAEGLVIKGEPGIVKVAAHGQARVDWYADAQEPGQAKLTFIAEAKKYKDAMQKSYPVYEHGVEKFLSAAAKLTGDSASIALDVPQERRSGSLRLDIQVTPSLAVTMLDALPYLVHYSYGCTEQTMSRFLPAAITAKTLKDLKLDPVFVAQKVFGGIEAEYADQTHPKGKADFSQIEDVIQKSLDRLYDFQHADGGWGWWKEGESDHYMSAYVVWGLALAKEAGVKIKNDVLARALKFLDQELVEQEDQPDLQAWMLHALTQQTAQKIRKPEFAAKALENLLSKRDKLNAYAKSLLAVSAYYLGNSEAAQSLVRNLVNGVKIDSDTGKSLVTAQESLGNPATAIAHWGPDRIGWRWSDSSVEATSFVLNAILTIDPQNQLVVPAVNWLVKNRRGSQWSNTKDTAIAVLALNQYLAKSGELSADTEYDLFVNDRLIGSGKITRENIFEVPSLIAVDPALLKSGANRITVRRKAGTSPVYLSAAARFFSTEEPIKPAANEIFLRRAYYKIVPQETLLAGVDFAKEALVDQGKVTSGQRVQVRLIIEAKNDYEYLVFEDLKPAGLEAVELKSGNNVYAKKLKSGSLSRLLTKSGEMPDESDYTGATRWVYQELRDRKVVNFIDKLPQGVWEISYELRAEVPGKFHALPALGWAMYVPEIRANSEEFRLEVLDQD